MRSAITDSRAGLGIPVPELSVFGFPPIFNLREEIRFHPDRLPSPVGLRFLDPLVEPLSQFRQVVACEAEVDLAGVDQLVAIPAAEVEPVKSTVLDRVTSDHQRLALAACRSDPLTRTTRAITTIAPLRDHALEAHLADALQHLRGPA